MTLNKNKDLKSYVPSIIQHVLDKNNITNLSSYYEFNMSVGSVFIDVSGFTAITEKVSQNSYYGVEIITDILNSYFDHVVPLVHQHGGSIFKFSGDAFLALFPQTEATFLTEIAKFESNLKQELIIINRELKATHDIELSIHGGYSFGEIKLQLVQNTDNVYDYVAIGEAISEAYTLCNDAKHGEILGNLAKSEMTCVSEIVPLPTSTIIDSFIPIQVREKLNQALFEAELRNCTILFVGIGSRNSTYLTIEQLQRCYSKTSKIVSAMGGLINKLDYTDKGYMLIITFGQLIILENQINRAINCAQELASINDDDFYYKIGFTTGSIYSGKIGSTTRAEFGIIGNSINISARLMSLCKNNEITFTQQILTTIKGYSNYKFIGKQKLKGIKDEIEIYKLVLEDSSTKKLYDNRYESTTYLPIHHNLDLDNILNDERITLIIGDSGMGKSTILYNLLKRFSSSEYFLSELYEFNRFTLYGYVEEILTDIIGIKSLSSNLDTIIDFAKNNDIHIDKTIIDSISKANLHLLSEEEISICDNFFISLLYPYFQQFKIYFIDNFEFIDLRSRFVLEKLIRKLHVNHVKIVATTHKELTSKILLPVTINNIVLHNLNDDDSASYIKSQLRNITSGAKMRLAKIANGNVLNLTELCDQLKTSKTKLNIINNDTLNVLFKDGKIASSIESYYLQNYDQLVEENKTILKIASIIGSIFKFNFIKNLSQKVINNIDEDTLANLCDKNYLRLYSTNPESIYVFKNQLFHQAVYKTIPLKEKIKYHKTIANYLEQQFDNDIKDYYEIIAQHFYFAKNHQKTAKYALLAAEKSLKLCMYNQALYFSKMVISSKQENATLGKIIAIEILSIMKKNRSAETFIKELEGNVPPELKCRFSYSKSVYYFGKAQFDKIIDLDVASYSCDDFYYFKTMLFILDSYRILTNKDKLESLATELEEQLKSKKMLLIHLKTIKAQYYIDTSQFELSLSTYSEAITISQELQNRYHEKIATIGAGVAYSNMGKLKEAHNYFKHAEELAKEIGDATGLNKILLELAIIERKSGNKSKAMLLYQRIYDYASEEGDLLLASTTMYNMGEFYYSNDDTASALEHIKKALDVQLKIQDKSGICFSYDLMGDIYFTDGNLEKAEVIYTENKVRQLEVGDKVGLAHSNMNLANILQTRKEFAKSLPLYLEQIAILKELHDVEGMGKALYNTGINYYYLKDLDSCITKLEEAKECFISCNNNDLLSTVVGLIGKLKK